MLSFWQMWQLVESQQPQGHLAIDWMMRVHFPEIIQYMKRHSDFAGQGSNKTQEALLRIMKSTGFIGQVARIVPNPADPTTGSSQVRDPKTGGYYSQEGPVVGVIIYELHHDRYEVPFLIGDNQHIVDALLDKMIRKAGDHHIIYVRTPYDMIVLSSLKAKGFDTRAQGDEVVGKYPKTNMQHPDIFSGYDQLKSGEVAPTNPADNDPYGLFKDKPWQDPEPEKDEFA